MATNTMMTMLELFHHKISIRIEVIISRKGDGGEWECTSVVAAL